jgi:hypothetical protein
MYGTHDILAALNGDEVADTAVLAKHVQITLAEKFFV